MLCFTLRMPLDFKEAVGEDDASKDNFCEVQKDQVPQCFRHRNKSDPRKNIIQCDMQIQTIQCMHALCHLQIADLLDTDSRNLKNCTLREGSVIVGLTVEGYEELEAAELEKATDDLQQMISEGQV